MASVIPTLVHSRVTVRPLRLRDARALEHLLLVNRAWLQKWEATSPYSPLSFDARGGIRALLSQARAGRGLPFVIEYDGKLAGQLNVSSISYGSLSSASIGYWVSEGVAGHGIMPTAVALTSDHCFFELGLHRLEICIRPENNASLRVVQKLGFRYEGLRRRYIHINGAWCDHYSFALVSEELAEGVLDRWLAGRAPEDAARVTAEDRAAAAQPLRVARGK
jgi:ribosomal-protein-alanine N-acetyltransferase